MMTPALIILSHYHSLGWPVIPSLFCEVCVDDSREEDSYTTEDICCSITATAHVKLFKGFCVMGQR